jgi:hypothetical protein
MAIALVSLAAGGSILAQEDQSEPKPAARQYPVTPDLYGDQDANPDQQSITDLTADTHPLTGVQVATIGTPEFRHSYWFPGFQYTNLIASSSINQTAASGWNTTNYLVGNLSLLENWSRSRLSVNYSGGAGFSSDNTVSRSYYQQLGLVQAFNWRRWQLSFIDQFSYLPQSQFGFGAGSNLIAPGAGGTLEPPLPGMQPNYQPNQSIFTSAGSRYSNSITSQVNYELSPRGSVTLSGSYGLLRFVEAGNISSNDAIFSLGYNYTISPRNTVGIVYRFSGYRYLGDPQAINDHVAQLAFGRKITGRLALQVFLGPDITTFRIPLMGSSQKISGGGGGYLSYALPRGNVRLSYNHGVGGGSGQFTGATVDQTQGDLAFQISRSWQGTLTFGYSRNKNLGVNNPSQVPQAFNSWFAGGGLNRPFGRDASFTLGYTAYLQNSQQPVCAVGSCATSYIQSQISVGFQWHTRPFVLR